MLIRRRHVFKVDNLLDFLIKREDSSAPPIKKINEIDDLKS